MRPAICDGGGEHQAAELGCSCWQIGSSCRCSLIRTGCGSVVCCSCAAGSDTLPGRRGESFAAVSGAFLLHLKPPRSERNPCCFLPILPSFLPPRGHRLAKPVAAPTSEAPYKNAKRDAVCRMAFFVSLLQRHSANARREITSYRFKCYTAENG